jgi:hypothetical protein
MTFSVIQGSRSLAGPFMEFDAQGPQNKSIRRAYTSQISRESTQIPMIGAF